MNIFCVKNKEIRKYINKEIKVFTGFSLLKISVNTWWKLIADVISSQALIDRKSYYESVNFKYLIREYLLFWFQRQEAVYSFGSSVFSPGEFPKRAQLLEAMATCHSITRIHGDLAGDPLDLKMFEFTQWELSEPNSEETDNFDKLSPPTVRPSKMSKQRHDDYEIGIIKQFPFSSSLQRMSVAVKVLNSDHFVLYVKGSPEKITEMSRPETRMY